MGIEQNHQPPWMESLAVQKMTLLIVDDDPDFLDFARCATDQLGEFFLLSVASTYTQAKKLTDNQAFDLIVCDYQLDCENGLDILCEAKQKFPDTRTILLTAHGEREVLTKALKMGVNAYLEKPCSIEAIEHILNSQRLAVIKDLALKESLSQYTNLVDAIPDIVYKIDRQGNIVFINKAVEALGYAEGELLGKPISLLIHPEDYPRINSQAVLQDYRGKATGDQKAPKLIDERRRGDRMTRNLHLRIMRKGARPDKADEDSVNVTVNAYGEISSTGVHEVAFGGKGEPFEGTVGLIRDISQRVKDERELIESRLRAEAANRAKNEFLANMSHETRTPLNSVLGMTELLSLGSLNAEQAQMLDTLKRGAEQLRDILDDLLALSRVENGTCQIKTGAFKISEISDLLVPMFTKMAQSKHLSFTVDQRNSNVVCYGDCELLQQVLSKLLSNAIKFTDEGSVHLKIQVESQRNMSFLNISVSDTGLGIPESMQDTIFDRFVQGDGSSTRRHGGTGVGLALCRELTEMMGGEVILESQLGCGACFKVKIPVGPMEEKAVILGKHFQPILIHILVVVEDQVLGLRLLRRLDRMGIRATWAGGAGEAIKNFMMSSVDAILVDEELALQGGGGLLREVRRFHDPAKVLPIFALNYRHNADVLKNVGVSDVLSISFRAGELMVLLERWRPHLESAPIVSADELLKTLGLSEG